MLVSDSSPSLPAKQSSSNSIPSCNVYFAASAENLCGCDACGGAAGAGAAGAGGTGVSLLHTRFCIIGAFRFAGFISSSGNCCPLNRKGKSSLSIFLVHPETQGSIFVSQSSVQCLYL